MGRGLTNETADKHEHIFPPYISDSPRPFPQTTTTNWSLLTKGDSKPFSSSTRYRWRQGHATFNGLLNLHDARYFVHAFNSLFLIYSRISLEGIQSVQFAFGEIRAWRALQIVMHANRGHGLACRLSTLTTSVPLELN
jgi:hypothetical protein